MDTILNPLQVPGWAELRQENPTRAICLQALTNLEIRYHQGKSPRPTRQAILDEAIRLGADLSPSSGQAVQRHLDTLAETGHVIKSEARGRSPWRSRYVLLGG